MLREVGNGRYTALTGTGTTTINAGQAASDTPKQDTGVFYGAMVVAVGTTYVIDAYDIIAPTNKGTNTATTTNKLMNGTCTAIGQVFPCGPSGIGVRYRGNLVVIQSGTAGQINALWD
jgi:hypothetical protein